jgi:hypothetical protein
MMRPSTATPARTPTAIPTYWPALFDDDPLLGVPVLRAPPGELAWPPGKVLELMITLLAPLNVLVTSPGDELALGLAEVSEAVVAVLCDAEVLCPELAVAEEVVLPVCDDEFEEDELTAVLELLEFETVLLPVLLLVLLPVAVLLLEDKLLTGVLVAVELLLVCEEDEEADDAGAELDESEAEDVVVSDFLDVAELVLVVVAVSEGLTASTSVSRVTPAMMRWHR